MPPEPLLLSVPNVSEGRDARVVSAVAEAFAPARILDVHSDPDHGRSVISMAAAQGELAVAIVAGAREATARIDLSGHAGLHPHVGALDVLPVVYVRENQRGAACSEALTAAAMVGEELQIPVFLYGELATGPERRERAALREGGPAVLRARVEAGALRPDFGPSGVDPRRGAVLATARPPLAAFNLDLQSEDLALAQAVARELREAGGGLPGVRAIGLYLPSRERAQVSINVHDPVRVPLAQVVARVAERAPIAEAEVVGLVPAAALDCFPEDVPLRDFDPERQIIERALNG